MIWCESPWVLGIGVRALVLTFEPDLAMVPRLSINSSFVMPIPVSCKHHRFTSQAKPSQPNQRMPNWGDSGKCLLRTSTSVGPQASGLGFNTQYQTGQIQFGFLFGFIGAYLNNSQDMMAMICQFHWWRKPEHPEETTDLWQIQ